MINKMTDVCSWDNPGIDRYTGSMYDAVMSFKDIPNDFPTYDRYRLAKKVGKTGYSDLVDIKKDMIISQKNSIQYQPWIESMHFGSSGKVCKEVTRDGWSEDHIETAMVYCQGSHCVAVPSVCGNVFRITKTAQTSMQKSLQSNIVSEPSTAFLIAIPLIILIILKKMKIVK